jgi:hypothetical protein
MIYTVNKAIKDGKIRPDQKAWALDYAGKDPAGFEVFIAKAPSIPQVPERFLSPESAREIDETQRMINSLCGVDEETYREHSPKEDAADQPRGDVDEVQALINKLCGVSDETFMKYRGQ